MQTLSDELVTDTQIYIYTYAYVYVAVCNEETAEGFRGTDLVRKILSLRHRNEIVM